MNKYTIQIPTVQFGLISVEIEGTHEDAVKEHQSLLGAYLDAKYSIPKEPEGLPPKEWNAWIDNYLVNGTGSSDIHARMSPEQQKIIKAIQLSMKRIKAHDVTFTEADEGPGKGENGDWSNQD